MDCSGDEFFPCAALARNQYASGCGRHLLNERKDVTHRSGSANQILQFSAIAKLALQALRFVDQVLEPDSSLKQGRDRPWVSGLFQKPECMVIVYDRDCFVD